MGLEVQIEPVFGQLTVEWAVLGSTVPPRQFLFHLHAPDTLRLGIHVTDFHSNTWEAVRSVSQLEDMQDSIGVGGSWSEFIDYLVNSIKSEDTKLVLEGCSDSDGAVNAKLVAQKSKGMPKISIALTKLVGLAATEAIANFSLRLFKEFKSINDSFVEERERSMQLSKVVSAEKERNESIQSQLEQYTKRQKIQRIGSSDVNGAQNSPEKQTARDTKSIKVVNRVVPAYRRAKVRGAVLQDIEDET
ncbi:PREDICTED: uncharacterized protein LOC101299176 [Fragaria vesca subsp. vesca]|uniref:uncharacterized protein LOC101299176 n=1 Tax=Fragaria vesca subsp. vesca TaxID=101020 RepID=UPI0002C34372|nr:PREDICTED: uncharacterized protein LOC101299176 [Fragaria vesca subsp. vesca]XP_004297053.1 PREDICTED: uncharacterized protein LOC101299176 [Fragaria vesca subsp. vesca]XP_011462832.1 PREDICTED: uncharacterized protein LOC101299176 [Fragaria vesca subsp. vesca]